MDQGAAAFLLYLAIIGVTIAFSVALLRWVLRINEIVRHLSTITELLRKPS